MKNAKLGMGALLFLGAALLVCAQAALATSVTVGLDKAAQGEGDKGTDFRPSGAGFIMTAKWGLMADGMTYNDDQNPDQTPGRVYVDKNGTGVWATAYDKHGKLDPGSDGISGGGPHGQEQLIFTFDAPVFLDSLIVGLVDFEFGSKIGDKDDPIFFLLLNDSSFIAVDETMLKPAFTSTGGKAGYVDLSLLTVPASNPLVDILTIHNAKDHYEVNSLTYDLPDPTSIPSAVPEPVTLFAAFAGICAVAGYARRRNAAAN